jgi:lipopolysaccharide/colanic/teichoic acid biosynthesis glycosyltransferase
LTTGRIFESVPRLGMPPRGFGDGRSPGLRAFSLLRFCTHHKDGQLTGLGGWLEKWDGHRLPELLNVLRGDMSMVGVKPLPVEAVNQINEAWQEQRHSYQSGFTGLWYLQNGRNAQLDETLITDTYYVATRTWREDQRILWQTPAAWSRHTRRAVISKLPT